MVRECVIEGQMNWKITPGTMDKGFVTHPMKLKIYKSRQYSKVHNFKFALYFKTRGNTINTSKIFKNYVIPAI